MATPSKSTSLLYDPGPPHTLTLPRPTPSSPDERILYAGKQDAVDLLQAVLEGEDEFDVNYRDGLGNTALHYAASTPSPGVLEILLETEGTDVDLQNRLDKATPLHLAAQLEHAAARQGVMEMLLDAGADPKIKDKHGSLPADYLHPDESEEDRQIIAMIDESIVNATLIGDADFAEDDDEEEGGGSESD